MPSIRRSLSCGSSSACHSMSSSPASARAVRALSPVSITGRTPSALSRATPSRASGRSSSRSASRPRARPASSSSSTDTVLPSFCKASMRARCPGASCATCSAYTGEPTARRRPSTRARTARPALAEASAATGMASPALSACRMMALASGWLEPDSTPAASASTLIAWLSSSSPSSPSKAAMSVTRSLPSVSVPVLSKAIAPTRPMVSSALPPLISSPCRVPAARPEAMAAGVDNTSAQGQAISSNARPR